MSGFGTPIGSVPCEPSGLVAAIRYRAKSRRTIIAADDPDPGAAASAAASAATTFGTVITSDNPIVVERAMYWNAAGQFWSAGTNATATRLP